MGKEDKKKPKPGKVVNDERFAAVHYDPRFQRFPKAHAKIEVDERFKGMFTDPTFRVGTALDKRGRKVKSKGKQQDDVKRYYRLKDEEDKEDKEDDKEDSDLEEKKKLDSSSSQSDDDDDSEEDEAEARWARMRGLTGPDTSSSEEEEDDDSDSDDENDSEDESDDNDNAPSASVDDTDTDDELEQAKKEWGVGALAANPEEDIILLPDATPRLACVDLDWEHVTAVDIFVALRSFVPSGGSIDRVTVYVSDYGKERMEAEAKAGPQGIWKESKRGKNNITKNTTTKQSTEKEDNDPDDNDISGSDDDDNTDSDNNTDASDSDADGEIDTYKLRLYERSKLRWYYAIVECDTATTANKIYEECDSMELMKTACKFDLRFVPDTESFDGRQIRDTATDIPDDYEPPVFQTKALQHTNVELTWDKGDDIRKRTLSRKLNAEEIKEDDFKAYLASSGSEDSSDDDDNDNDSGDGGHGGRKEDADVIRERYRKLLLSGGNDGDDGKKSKKKGRITATERTGTKDWTGDHSGSDDDDYDNDNDNDDDDDDKNMEMEVTFLPGLENLGEKLLEKKQKKAAAQGETVWEAYVRRKKEKKAEARRLGKTNIDSDDDSDGSDEYDSDDSGNGGDDVPAGVEDDPFFQHDENPFDDPFFNDGGGSEKKDLKKKKKGEGTTTKNNKKKKKGNDSDADDKDDRKRRAELEMLLMDEGALRQSKTASKQSTDNTKTKLSKKERARLKKEQRKRERQAGSDDEDHEDAGIDFAVNMQDPRFQDLFKSADFALDPTDPRFKKAGPGASKLASEAAKRRSKLLEMKENGGGGGGDNNNSKKKKSGGDAEKTVVKKGSSDAADLKLMVASLKRKAAADLNRKSKK